MGGSPKISFTNPLSGTGLLRSNALLASSGIATEFEEVVILGQFSGEAKKLCTSFTLASFTEDVVVSVTGLNAAQSPASKPTIDINARAVQEALRGFDIFNFCFLDWLEYLFFILLWIL